MTWSGTFNSSTRDVVSNWNAKGVAPSIVTDWFYQPSPSLFTLSTNYQLFKIENVTINASVNNMAVFIWTDDFPKIGDELFVGNVKLEAGTTSTDFESRDMGTELGLCQRYYWKTFPQNEAPRQNSDVLEGTIARTSVSTTSNAALYTQIGLPFIMVKNPTLTTYNPKAANDDGRNNDISVDVSAFTQFPCDRGFVVSNNAATNADQKHYIHVTAEAEF